MAENLGDLLIFMKLGQKMAEKLGDLLIFMKLGQKWLKI